MRGKKNEWYMSFYCKYPYREIIAHCICAQHIEWQFKEGYGKQLPLN